MSVKLEGLTVVLIEAVDDGSAHARNIELVMETFLRSKELGSSVRLFSVGQKLVELMHMPETFAWLGSVGAERPAMAASVNRVNILRPRRIVVVVRDIIPTRIGRAREGTAGYIWATSTPLGRESFAEWWRVLTCEPLQIPITIRASEQADQVVQERTH